MRCTLLCTITHACITCLPCNLVLYPCSLFTVPHVATSSRLSCPPGLSTSLLSIKFIITLRTPACETAPQDIPDQMPITLERNKKLSVPASDHIRHIVHDQYLESIPGKCPQPPYTQQPILRVQSTVLPSCPGTLSSVAILSLPAPVERDIAVFDHVSERSPTDDQYDKYEGRCERCADSATRGGGRIGGRRTGVVSS